VITADPQSSTNNAGDTVSFTVSATGPSLSYQWRKNGSNLTDGGNVSGASSSALTLSNVGVTDASNYNVVVSNPGGSVTSAVASLTVICPAVGMTPASLPDGTLNASYSQTLSGTGGAAPYSFGVTSGSLPAGLTLSSSGVVSGVPTTTGTNNFTATATDAHGCAGSQPYTIVINCPVITLSPSTLPDGVVGASYNQTVTASGGVGPYTFAVSAGTLPTGVNLSSSGNLSGTLSNAGAYTFTLTATGSAGCQGSGSYT